MGSCKADLWLHSKDKLGEKINLYGMLHPPLRSFSLHCPVLSCLSTKDPFPVQETRHMEKNSESFVHAKPTNQSVDELEMEKAAQNLHLKAVLTPYLYQGRPWCIIMLPIWGEISPVNLVLVKRTKLFDD